MHYPKEAIEKATAWVDGSPSAKLWLEENNFPELVYLKDAASRHSKAFEYLLCELEVKHSINNRFNFL